MTRTRRLSSSRVRALFSIRLYYFFHERRETNRVIRALASPKVLRTVFNQRTCALDSHAH